MRRMACAIFSMIIAVPACATEKAWSVDTTISDTISTQFEQQTDILASSVDEIIEKIRDIDPNFVWFLESSGLVQENKKVNVVRSYLAYKSYETYKNKFLADLKRRSRETGREIKTKHFESGIMKESFYWLDRGRLDQPECHLNGDVNDAYVCKFPDGFEDFYVVFTTYLPTNNTIEDQVTNFMNQISGNDGMATMNLYLNKDIPGDNISMSVSVRLDSNNVAIEQDFAQSYDTLIESVLHASMSVREQKYTDNHEYRNNIADSVLRTGNLDAAVMQTMVPETYAFSNSITLMNQLQKRGTKK